MVGMRLLIGLYATFAYLVNKGLKWMLLCTGLFAIQHLFLLKAGRSEGTTAQLEVVSCPDPTHRERSGYETKLEEAKPPPPSPGAHSSPSEHDDMFAVLYPLCCPLHLLLQLLITVKKLPLLLLIFDCWVESPTPSSSCPYHREMALHRLYQEEYKSSKSVSIPH